MKFTLHIDFEALNISSAVAIKDIVKRHLDTSPIDFSNSTVVLTPNDGWSISGKDTNAKNSGD